jgi:hypothetical protein
MSATSIRLPGLLLAGLLVLSAPLGAQDKSATIQEVSYIAPSNFGQMLQSSDLVARVRITDAKQNVVGPADSGIFSELTATVVEAYRAKTPLAAGAPIKILQEGGEANVGSKRLRIVADFERLAKGKEYVLFLTWNKPVNAYQVNYGPDGAFEIRGQKLRAIGSSPTAQEQAGDIVAFQDKLQQTLAAQKR